MKKRLTTLAFASLLSLCLIGSVSAAGLPATGTASTEPTATTRAEEKKWYYRVVNGQIQGRLWSITEGVWLTDWINM